MLPKHLPVTTSSALSPAVHALPPNDNCPATTPELWPLQWRVLFQVAMFCCSLKPPEKKNYLHPSFLMSLHISVYLGNNSWFMKTPSSHMLDGVNSSDVISGGLGVGPCHFFIASAHGLWVCCINVACCSYRVPDTVLGYEGGSTWSLHIGYKITQHKNKTWTCSYH